MNTIPELRFQGFTDAWEQRKLGELLEFRNGFNGGAERYGTGIPLISVMDILSNDFITSGNIRTRAKLTETEFQRFKVEYGDVLFQRSSENIDDAGTSNVYMDGDKSAVFGGFVICGKKKTDYNPLFMKYGLTSKNVRMQIMSKAQGAQHINVSQDTLQGIVFYIPPQNEQDKIGKYFSTLDHLIALHQRKYERLENLKQAMLVKMFPQGKEAVPELRFEGFTEPWEQRKLGEIASSFEYGLNAAAKEYDGENKYIRITDIDDNTHEFLTDGLTSPDTDLSDAENYKLAEGDILFARTGASVGKSYIYRASDGLVYYAGFLIRTRIRKEYDAEFIFQNTLTDKYNKYIAVTSQRSGQPGVNAQEYSEFEIQVPKKEEQKQIGTYFRNLDHLITLHQRKYEQLKNLKQAMMAKMFPSENA